MNNSAENHVKNYAEALFALAKESGLSCERIYKELCLVRKAFEENSDFHSLLEFPTVTRDEKQALIKSVFEGRVSSLTFDFLCVLVDNERAGEFFGVCERFKELYYKAEHITEVRVTTASPLSAALRASLEKKLAAKLGSKIILAECVDESLIGGIILDYNDRQIDGSVRNKLSQMKRSLDGVIA